MAEVQGWLRERAEAIEAQVRAAAVIAAVDQKVAAFRLLFPSLAAELVDHIPTSPAVSIPGIEPEKQWDRRSGGKEPLTDAVVRLLSEERGGRTIKWVRTKLLADSDFAERMDRNPNGVGNAVVRLVARKLIVKVGNLLYHPNVLNEIRSGRMEEEREPNVSAKTFTSMMEEVVAAMGGRFTAGEAIEAARNNPATAEKLAANPSAVYSWLGRLVQRRSLTKEGEYYVFPKRNITCSPNEMGR